ncbi:hypothetical protein LJR030_004120 [Rhizobium sp. LjRoot30]|uniref:hypothetical protein n=1 Tax=Rhizobium sp. LjRoot30 TaxID=3342320 RepID=UPI003ED0B954
MSAASVGVMYAEPTKTARAILIFFEFFLCCNFRSTEEGSEKGPGAGFRSVACRASPD